MKRFLCAWLLAAGLLAATGCAALYTGIHQEDANTYTLTRVSAGFFRVYGSVYSCEASGTSMQCREIDRE